MADLCVHDGCTNPAIATITTGISMVAVDDDGYCWDTEARCYDHAHEEAADG